MIFLILQLQNKENGAIQMPSIWDSEIGGEPTLTNWVNHPKNNRHQQNNKDHSLMFKKILFWNSYFSSKDFELGLGRTAFKDAGCRITNCLLTDDRRLLDASDAVIFHANDFNEKDLPNPAESTSPTSQSTVHFLQLRDDGHRQRHAHVYANEILFQLDHDLSTGFRHLRRPHLWRNSTTDQRPSPTDQHASQTWPGSASARSGFHDDAQPQQINQQSTSLSAGQKDENGRLVRLPLPH